MNGCDGCDGRVKRLEEKEGRPIFSSSFVNLAGTADQPKISFRPLGVISDGSKREKSGLNLGPCSYPHPFLLSPWFEEAHLLWRLSNEDFFLSFFCRHLKAKDVPPMLSAKRKGTLHLSSVCVSKGKSFTKKREKNDIAVTLSLFFFFFLSLSSCTGNIPSSLLVLHNIHAKLPSTLATDPSFLPLPLEQEKEGSMANVLAKEGSCLFSLGLRFSHPSLTVRAPAFASSYIIFLQQGE